MLSKRYLASWGRWWTGCLPHAETLLQCWRSRGYLAYLLVYQGLYTNGVAWDRPQRQCMLQWDSSWMRESALTMCPAWPLPFNDPKTRVFFRWVLHGLSLATWVASSLVKHRPSCAPFWGNVVYEKGMSYWVGHWGLAWPRTRFGPLVQFLLFVGSSLLICTRKRWNVCGFVDFPCPSHSWREAGWDLWGSPLLQARHFYHDLINHTRLLQKIHSGEKTGWCSKSFENHLHILLSVASTFHFFGPSIHHGTS